MIMFKSQACNYTLKYGPAMFMLIHTQLKNAITHIMDDNNYCNHK